VRAKRTIVAAAVAVVAGAAAAAVLADGGGGGSGSRVRPPTVERERPAPRAAERPDPVRITIAVAGDLLIHSPVFDRALQNGGGGSYRFDPMFSAIRPIVRRADLAVCHVETPLSRGPPHGYPLFSTPASLAGAVARTGWDACDTASNHTLDLGQAGIDGTIAALRRAGLRHTGSYRSPAGRRRILMLRAKGVRVAYLAYTEMTNGIPLPHGWSLNLAETRRILADARRARARGARAVIVNVHWGPPEFTTRPAPGQLRLARRLVRSPAITAVVGQGPHSVWPIRRARHGKAIVFSEGNLISNQTAACCAAAAQDGLIALVQLTVGARRARVRRVDYVPLWVRHPDYAVLPVGRALARGWADAATLRESYRRTVAVAGRSRRIAPVPRRLR
jgi:poly-gamma-glutamate synthesis protein (capsule biosynthesis protein)